MVNYNNGINHDTIWKYLNQLAKTLSQEQLKILNQLFQLMKQDYTLEQEFGEANLQFLLVKEDKPYLNNNLPNYMIEENENDNIREMLMSFNEAKSHLETYELMCLASILSILDDNQLDMNFIEENSGIKLVFHPKTLSNIPKHL